MKIKEWLRGWLTPAELPARNPLPDHIRKPPPYVQPSLNVSRLIGPLPADLDMELTRLRKQIEEGFAKLTEKRS